MTQKELIDKLEQVLTSDYTNLNKVLMSTSLIRQYKASKTDKPRCKICAHFGTINYWGQPIEKATKLLGTHCCPFKPNERRKGTYKMLPTSTIACEHFVQLNNKENE